jgi:hypothetical protein
VRLAVYQSVVLTLQRQGEKRISDLAHRLERYLTSAGKVPLPHITPTAAAISLFGWFPYPSSNVVAPIEILQCRICERRIGLWSFRKPNPRLFDLANEHLSWCPIRYQEGDKAWWEGSEVLRRETKVVEVGAVGKMLRVSQKLKTRAWREVKVSL